MKIRLVLNDMIVREIIDAVNNNPALMLGDIRAELVGESGSGRPDDELRVEFAADSVKVNVI